METKPARKLNQSTKGTTLPKSARDSKLPNNARPPLHTVTTPNTIAAIAPQFAIRFAFMTSTPSPRNPFFTPKKAVVCAGFAFRAVSPLHTPRHADNPSYLNEPCVHRTLNDRRKRPDNPVSGEALSVW